MKRPSFQFYAADWIGNANLRRCTHAEKGVWIDVMCLMHDSDEYGVLRWTLKEIAQAVGCRVADLKSLMAKGVLKGADSSGVCDEFVYVPRSGRKDGNPVTLIQRQNGPVFYSSRMVRDEYVRAIRGESTRFGGDPDDLFGDETGAPKTTPKHSPKGGFGDGSTSSSSTSYKPFGAAASNQPPLGESPPAPEPAPAESEQTPPPGENPPSPEPSADAITARSVEIAVLLRNRGAGVAAGEVRLREWAERGITDAALLAALETAQLRRADAGSVQPVNSGLLDSILADVVPMGTSPPARASPSRGGKQAAHEAYLASAAAAARKHGLDEPGGSDERSERDITGQCARVA